MDEETKPIDREIEIGSEPENGIDIELTKTKNYSVVKEKSSDLFDEENEGQLSIDVFQTPEEIIIEAPIAGVKPEDLDIDITNESVTIKGKREKEKEIKEEDFFYQECYWGRFFRSIVLPQEIDAEKSEASLKEGILKIVLPKLDRQKSKKIKVKIKQND